MLCVPFQYYMLLTTTYILFQVYFLNNPNVDFAVGGLANVTDLPGISSILRSEKTRILKIQFCFRQVIVEQLAQFIVLPNKVSVPLVNNIPMKVSNQDLSLFNLQVGYFYLLCQH